MTSAKRRVRLFAQRFGVDIHRYFPMADVDVRRERMMRALHARTVVDVGANEGQYGHRLRESGFRGRIISFEPQAAAFAVLQSACNADPDWTCFKLALGEGNASVEIHVAANSRSSSLLPMARRHLEAAPQSRYVGTEQVRLARLDSLADELELMTPIYLKLDVQGLEMAVLRGVGDLVERVAIVECELSTKTLYEGQSLYREVIDTLDGLGFDLATIEEGLLDHRLGQVLQLDAIFVRRSLFAEDGDVDG